MWHALITRMQRYFYDNMVVVFHCFIDEFGGYLQLFEQFDALCVEGSMESCCDGYE